VAQTLGQQLDEIETSLSAARKAISYKMGDKELTRSYALLKEEKTEILAKINRHGRDYVEGMNTVAKRSGPVFKKAVWK